jgi:uncharacterized hydrophobic protein (TIGR00271 family)
MSPILGVGLAFGTSDRELLEQSIRPLATAVVVSLAVATLYFLVSPLGEVTRELQARTRPTLLDAGVAFFGGVAGIVAGSRERAGSAIPGVAIATALMPPLCTVGFGLASGDWAFALGAFYLFFINAVLIALATYSIVRLMRFPLRAVVAGDARRRRIWLTTAVSIVLLPSVVILVGVVRDARRQRALNGFADAVSSRTDRTVLRWAVRTENDTTTLSLFVAGAPMSAAAEDSLLQALRARGVADVQLRVVETGLPSSAREALTGEATLAAVKAAEAVASRTVQLAMARMDSVRTVLAAAPDVRALQGELRSLAPEIDALELGTLARAEGDSVRTRLTAIASVRGRVTTQGEAALRSRIGAFLSQRLRVDTVAVELRTGVRAAPDSRRAARVIPASQAPRPGVR